MRKPGGYACIVEPDKATREADTFSCVHCNTIVHVPAKADVNFFSICRQCMAPVCKRCAGKGCVPFLKKLEIVEARDRALRSYGL